MKAYKIPLSAIQVKGSPDLTHASLLEEIIVHGAPNGDSTEQMCKACRVYGHLESRSNPEIWWADSEDFNFLKQRIDSFVWGNLRVPEPTKVRMQLATWVTALKSTKEEEVPGT